jgi:hypothetical protein
LWECAIGATAPCKQQAKKQEALNPCAKPRETGCARLSSSLQEPGCPWLRFDSDVHPFIWVRFGKKLLA